MIRIAPYEDELHRADVVALWTAAFGYATAHNAPGLSIDRKLAVADGLLFVALDEREGAARVAGTVMAGYDGHRGWLYSVAVDPERRGGGIGSALVAHAEAALAALGCMKINLQIVGGNEAVTAFYEALGYVVEPRISMGKRIAANIPAPQA
ncbi:GNAT family acetyltransferase [Variovorax sp. J22P168]|uniref:GNAT family acetyltransferase n=1 Tax=Variovorax jilinensis TaxID=3053513 RepID=UPI0025773572|nr:GNAT family acetyltransferase [Variovorax sp. J22P168]MDM0012458.1 GNAT family acetyltransferase [Variovorax sp. J22P168]